MRLKGIGLRSGRNYVGFPNSRSSIGGTRMPSFLSTCDHRGSLKRGDASPYKVSSQTVAPSAHPFHCRAAALATFRRDSLSIPPQVASASSIALGHRFGIAVASYEPVVDRLTRAGHPNSAHMVEVMKQTDIRSRRRFLKSSSMLGLAAAFSADIGESFAERRTKNIQVEGRMSGNDMCQCRA